MPVVLISTFADCTLSLKGELREHMVNSIDGLPPHPIINLRSLLNGQARQITSIAQARQVIMEGQRNHR
ncbi:hypothetical protein ACHAXR_013466 [Thalassiosira sp. AJA248-18]